MTHWMWNDCIHHGIHYVDLSWKGAVALGVAVVFGFWLGRCKKD